MVRWRMLPLMAGTVLLGCGAARPLDVCQTPNGKYPDVSVRFEWKTDMLHYTEYVLPPCPGVVVAVYDGRLSAGDRRRMADLAFDKIDKAAGVSVSSVSFAGTYQYDAKRGLREFFPTKILELR